MADEAKPTPFVRTVPMPTEGAPSPFARPPGARPGGAVVTRPTPATPAPAPAAVRSGGQNLPLGLLAGCVAAAIGAALWAGITVLTGYQIGWMAVGVGALVGVAVRAAGKGSTKTFGILGAGLALVGCLVGNLLTGAVVLARHWDISLAAVFTQLTPDTTARLMTAMFSPMDLLFYALAIWQGYKFSIVVSTK